MFESITFSEFTVAFSWSVAIFTLILFKKLPKNLKLFGLWLIISPILIIYPQHLANNGQHNLFWRHVINHFDFAMLTFFYFKLFFEYKKMKLILLSCFVIYCGFSIFSTITYETWAVYPATMAFTGNSFIIFYALLFYHQLYTEEKIVYLEKDGFFLINSGLFLYYMSTLFIYLALNLLTFKSTLSLYIFFDNIDCAIYILSKIIFARALWIVANKSVRSTSSNC